MEGLRNNCIWRIDDGRSVNLWKDIRVPSFRNLMDYKTDGFELVFDLIEQHERTWKEDIVTNIFPPWIAECILTIPLAKTPTKDKMVRPYQKNGQFSVKSCYHLLHEQRTGYGANLASSSNAIQPWF